MHHAEDAGPVRVHFSEARGAWKVEADLTLAGGDGCIWLYGGNGPHIGAVAIGVAAGQSMETEFSGHREGIVVCRFRDALLEKGLLRHCVVCCGIHYDEIDALGIETVLGLCWKILDGVCSLLKRSDRVAAVQGPET